MKTGQQLTRPSRSSKTWRVLWVGGLNDIIQRASETFSNFALGPARSPRKPLILLGHLDTVWPMGTLRNMPWREEKGRYWGPGVLDMKAGVVMALAAVSTLQELKLERPVTLLLNSEEEVGSPVSRAITERLARDAAGSLRSGACAGVGLQDGAQGSWLLSC